MSFSSSLYRSAKKRGNEFAKIGKEIRKIQASALNRSVRSGIAETTKLIRRNYNIKSSVFKNQIHVQKAHGNKLFSRITVREKKIPLSEFGARQTKRGVSAAVKKGKRTVYRNRAKNIGSFLAVMKSGRKGVFLRKGRERLPIVGLYGPSAAQLFSSSLSEENLYHDVYEKYSREIFRRVGRL